MHDHILEFGDFSGCPEDMTLAPESRIYIHQREIYYPVTSTNETAVSSLRIRLNLYFNPVCHSEHLVELSMAVSEQEAMVPGLIEEVAKVADPISLRRQYRFLVIDIAVDAILRGCVRNGAKMEKVRTLAGFSVVMTHMLDCGAVAAKTCWGLR